MKEQMNADHPALQETPSGTPSSQSPFTRREEQRARGRAFAPRSRALALAEVLKRRCLRRSERCGPGALLDVGCGLGSIEGRGGVGASLTLLVSLSLHLANPHPAEG